MKHYCILELGGLGTSVAGIAAVAIMCIFGTPDVYMYPVGGSLITIGLLATVAGLILDPDYTWEDFLRSLDSCGEYQGLHEEYYSPKKNKEIPEGQDTQKEENKI